MQLSEGLRKSYRIKKPAIRKRLAEFSALPANEYFYELAFCLLTPQSSQKNAEIVIDKLKKNKFLEKGFKPTRYLNDKKHYIRFHNVKSDRLLKLRKQFSKIGTEIEARKRSSPYELREFLMESVLGLGLKEASHFLRNIGSRNLAILDRHILKHLFRLGVIVEIPKSLTRKRYLEIEQRFIALGDKSGIPMDELDLLFWSEEVGEIRK